MLKNRLYQQTSAKTFCLLRKVEQSLPLCNFLCECALKWNWSGQEVIKVNEQAKEISALEYLVTFHFTIVFRSGHLFEE